MPRYDDARRILAALEEAATHAVHAQRGTEGMLNLLRSSSLPLGPRLLAGISLIRRYLGS